MLVPLQTQWSAGELKATANRHEHCDGIPGLLITSALDIQSISIGHSAVPRFPRSCGISERIGFPAAPLRRQGSVRT
jgi:hypothetical protein